jgi:hypothetical protein
MLSKKLTIDILGSIIAAFEAEIASAESIFGVVAAYERTKHLINRFQAQVPLGPNTVRLVRDSVEHIAEAEMSRWKSYREF